MAKEVVSIEVLEGKASGLRELQSEYEEITRRIIAFINSTDELPGGQDDINKHIRHIHEFENMTQRSKRVLEGLTLDIQASIEFVRQLNMECVYASPRDIFKL